MISRNRLGVLIAASMIGVAAPRPEPTEPPPEPQPSTPPERPDSPRPKHATRPKYADEVTARDLDRLTAAIAKRQRKAAKRLQK
jgi:hypothetical protein